MSFYPCLGGGNLDNVEEKEFKNEISGTGMLTNITLDKSYQFAYIVATNNERNIDDKAVYVSLNGVKQKGTYVQPPTVYVSEKAVILRKLKKGDVITVRGLGIGIFIK